MWDKTSRPDDEIIAQVLSILIFQKASREEVTDWATAWYTNDNYHPEPHLRDALHALTGADMKTAPHTYLYSDQDFIQWQADFLKRRPTDNNDGIAYVEERVVFHDASNTFAIHDVYFDAQGQVVTMTEDALSPRADSVPELEAVLQQLWSDAADGADVVSGDLHYTYDRDDIEVWLDATRRSILPDTL